jgi:putative ABC transport system permease protein
MVLGEGMWLLAIALPLGLAVAWMSTRFLQTLLFGVSAFDVGTTVTAALVLAGAALAACYIPARRAANVDPLQAIRSE